MRFFRSLLIFNKQETVNLDYEKLDYPATVAPTGRIRKKLKYLT
jgi:hypothetical protein